MSKNRILSLVLALVMVLGTVGSVFAASPVKTTVDAGNFLKLAGVLKGNDDGDLLLDQHLTRQDAVILVAQLRGEIEEAQSFPGLPTYEDVEIKFYNAPLAWAQANGLFQGYSEKEFGFGDNITAQQYSRVLFEALGYKVNGSADSDFEYKDAFEKANDAGILAGVETAATTEITRGQMALMTFNALGLNMKDSKETLAEHLGIEMPTPEKPAELKVEKVYTENLAEIVVELSNASLANKEKLEDSNNYKLTGFSIVKAELQGDNVVLSLKKDTSLVKGRKYDLLVRGLGKELNNKYEFTAFDNTIPAVEKVEALGEYGIKVTTTEPVKNPLERNFLIDGKNVAMEVEQYGRDIILTPYYKASFDTKAEKLTVKELVDYEGYRSVEKDFEIEIKEDKVEPKVVDVVANNKEVKVTFDKDIYANSVGAYFSRVSVGNISYEAGRHAVYAEKAEKVSPNQVVYTFKDELPRRTVVTITGVQNHSKVEMEKTTEEARIVLDNLEPEIIDHKVRRLSDSSVKIELYFDKDITGSLVATSETDFVAKDHFALYQGEVLNRNLLEDKFSVAKYAENRKDVVEVTLVDLEVNNKDRDYNYILEVVDFKDMSSNKMYRDYVDFDIKQLSSSFKVEDIVVRENKVDTEITIFFNKAVDRASAEDLTSYIFRRNNDQETRFDVKELGGRIITERNGKEVTIILPEFNKDNYKSLEILETIKDKDGNRVAPASRYIFGTNFDVLVTRAEDAVINANALLPGTGTANELALGVAKSELEGLKDLTTGYEKVNHDVLVNAIKKVENAISKVKADNEASDKEALLRARAQLRAAIREAELLIKDAPASTEKTAVINAIANSKIVVESDLATTAQLNDSKSALDSAVSAYNNAAALPGIKAEAKDELDSYISLEDYTINAEDVRAAIATGKANIDAATDAAGVESALENAKLAVDAIKSDEEQVQEDVNTAISGLTNASVTITDAEAQPTVVLNVPETVNGVAFTFTAKTDDNATVTIAEGALSATVTRNAIAGNPTITVTATKGSATATAVYKIIVPAGETDAVTVELQ